MSAPPIVSGLTPAALIPYILAAATAWLFWTRVVPRQLRGLQVAFVCCKWLTSCFFAVASGLQVAWGGF